MKTITETKTYLPTEVIPMHTLAECGEGAMHREFADLVRATYHTATVNNWTVTLTGRTDANDVDYLRNKLIENMAALAVKSMRAFA